MKILSILVGSFLCVSCAVTPFPMFPETIKFHYALDIHNVPTPELFERIVLNLDVIPKIQPQQIARCLKFEIISKIPYKIKFLSEVELVECQGVGGYKPEDSISLYNWMDDVGSWAETRKKCFK